MVFDLPLLLFSGLLRRRKQSEVEDRTDECLEGANLTDSSRVVSVIFTLWQRPVGIEHGSSECSINPGGKLQDQIIETHLLLAMTVVHRDFRRSPMNEPGRRDVTLGNALNLSNGSFEQMAMTYPRKMNLIRTLILAVNRRVRVYMLLWLL